MTTCFSIQACTITVFLLLISAALTTGDFVRDIDGDYVMNGRAYYILPELIGVGPLTWIPNNTTSCPLFITPKDFLDGTPAKIASPLRILFLPLSSPVFITFEAINTPCSEPLAWSVTPDEPTSQSYVVAGNGDPEWPPKFRIEKATSVSGKKYVYKISFCNGDSFGCVDVGYSKEGNEQVLGLNPGSPLPVLFAKAFDVLSHSSSASSM